jgi:hypothetical protein
MTMPSPFFFKSEGNSWTFAKDESGSDAKKIDILAYNGGLLRLAGMSTPVIVDLDGLDVSAMIPLLVDHKITTSAILGQGRGVRHGDVLRAEGVVTGTGSLAQEVVANSKNGHVYQASVGVTPHESRFIDEDTTIKVNGKNQTGPFILATKSELIEVSAVSIGADRDGTEFNIAATFGLDIPSKQERKESTMDPELIAWVQASLGLNEEEFTALDKEKQDKIEVTYKASLSKKDAVVGGAITEIKATGGDAELAAQVAGLQEEVRISKIEAACGSDFTELQKKAIDNNWSLDQVNASISEIQKVRDSRPAAPGVMVAGELNDGKVIEAALAMTFTSMDDKKLNAHYGDEALSRAEKLRGATLKEIMAASCHVDGVAVPGIGSSPAEWAASAFSTRTFPNVLSNLANKSMMESFGRRESVAAQVSKKLSAKDFKINTQTRISAGGGMKKLENGAEINHGTIEDVARTYSLDTYAEMLGLSRQDIINDDLGAFAAIPEQMGFDAWQLREEAFWTLVLDNSDNFFGTGNGNLSTGAGSALGLDGLSAAITLMEKQTDEKGRAIQVTPDFLVVPSELSRTADGIYTSEKIVTGEDSTQVDRNIYNGKYRPKSTPFLSNSTIPGYSATAWYLFADPRITPAFGISYLNGRETPIIEETDPDPRYLGRVFRIYYDFGVDKMEPKGAVKSNGA